MSKKAILYDSSGEIVKRFRVPAIETPWFAIAVALAASVVFGIIGYHLKPSQELTLPTCVTNSGSSIVFSSVANSLPTSDSPPEVKAPLGHPPLSIVVGARIYAIHYTTRQWLELHQCGGFTLPDKQQIWLGRNIDDALEQRHVLLHELMHASIAAHGEPGYQGRGGQTLDDDFIEATSPALLGILRDNPQLIEWLQKG